MKTIEELKARMAELLAQRGALHGKQTALIETARTGGDGGQARGLTPEEQKIYDDADTEKRGLDEQIEQTDARVKELTAAAERDQRAEALRRQYDPAPGRERAAGGASVTREERTYSPEKSRRGEASFFIDAYAAQRGDFAATQRVQRHMHEMQVEGELSQRAIGTGSVAGLVVPQYLTDLAALVLRTGRPAANACQGLQLPSQGMSLIIPRGTTGAAVAAQATENSAVQNTDEAWSNLTVPVVTIAGQQDLSRQLLERGTPGIDELVYRDLAAAYHAELDAQVVNGSGTGNTMLGILQTSGGFSATAYGAVISAAKFQSKIAGLIGSIAGAGTMLSPDLILAHPRRWAWLNSLTDSDGRPLVVPSVGGPMNVVALNERPGAASGDGDASSTETLTSVGALQGLPVFTDGNVPTDVGTNDEDQVAVVDRRQCLLWEDGDGQPTQLRFEQTLGNQLTVKLVIYGYAAFTAGRYPKAIGKVGGLDTTATYGQVAPTF